MVKRCALLQSSIWPRLKEKLSKLKPFQTHHFPQLKRMYINNCTIAIRMKTVNVESFGCQRLTRKELLLAWNIPQHLQPAHCFSLTNLQDIIPVKVASGLNDAVLPLLSIKKQQLGLYFCDGRQLHKKRAVCAKQDLTCSCVQQRMNDEWRSLMIDDALIFS